MDGIDEARRRIREEKERKTGKLDLSGLGLTELPEEIGELGHLRELNLSVTLDFEGFRKNPISDLSPLSRLCALESLDCLGTQVTDLAPLANLRYLQDFVCSLTPVADLSPLENLQSLQRLACLSTSVVDLGPLANLRALQVLDCTSTAVADLRPLGSLKSLSYLDCRSTKVESLEPLANLKALGYLDCRMTKVENLGPLANLQSLQVFDCSITRVTDLGPLLNLEGLGELHANGCQLKNFPNRLVATLRELSLYETNLPGVPAEVLSHAPYENCLPRLHAHLADLEAGTEAVRRAKLVVLGNGRVGKTQICRQLQELPYDPSIPSTHGICVSNVACEALGPGEELNLWDFGGQDIYHGTHALFMRTRSLFVIVWHPDFEQAGEESRDGIRFRNYPLAYWLDYVRTLGDAQSPVIVVQSRCDRPELEARRLPADSEGIKFLKQCWHSVKEGRGKDSLLEAIRDGVKHLREREGVSIIGKGRAKVIEILEGWRKEDERQPREKRQHRTLSQADFRALCENTGGISSPESLLDYLHQLGVVFYQPGLFSDAIILDQSWALDAVYAVFEREKSFRQIASMGGRFTRSLLDMTVWGEYSPKEQELFLSLMQSAGVCFVRRQADTKLDLQTEYVAPDLLPDRAAVADQLSGRWTEGQGARIEFHYPFLHTGLMRGLICDAGKLAGENGVYWKYGVWVYDRESGARALIEMYETEKHGGRVCAWIQQGRPERLARWLRERFAEQNRRFGYPDLKPTVDELPCVDEKMADKVEHGDKPSSPKPVEPALGPMPASQFPRQGPEVFISYAWGDNTEEGRRRADAVDSIYSALASEAVRIHRDKADLKTGDRIRDFMNRLIGGDVVVVVLSDKYLRSLPCMYELFGVYGKCQHDADRFLKRVIPVVLPDAKISKDSDRMMRVRSWEQECEDLDHAIRGLKNVSDAGESVVNLGIMVDITHNLANMLAYLDDVLVPRDLEEMKRNGFIEIIELIRKGQR